MIAISPGFGFMMVVALEELLVLEALGVEANQMVVEPVINKLLSNRHYAVRISGHRFGRGRHHGRRRWPGNSTATPGVRQLEAELQEELLGLPEIREVGWENCQQGNSLVPVGPESLLGLVHLA